MAQLNPFPVGLHRGKRRTLAEIEAATNGSKAMRSQRRDRVSSWAHHQRLQRGDEDAMGLHEPGPSKPRFRIPSFLVLDDEDEDDRPSNRGPSNQPIRAGERVNPFSRPASSRHPSSNTLKRKASRLEDHEDDLIVVRSQPCTPRHGLCAAEVVDLTRRDDRTKRITSYFGNRDDDVIIVEPPAAETRRALRSLVLGVSNSLDTRSAKRPKHTHAEPQAAARPERRAPQIPATNAVGPNAAEIPGLLESVESVTHFFSLATELRDKIYRQLLVSPNPIHVQHLWTEPSRRPSRRRTRSAQNDVDDNITIDPRILYVCRRTAVEGTRILYSENTFHYLLRDPEVVGNNARRKRGTIDLDKYSHLLRHMEIELEPNRTGPSYQNLMAAALKKLASPRTPSPSGTLRGPIHLHTLTITVSPLFETSQRTVRAHNQDVTIRQGRFLSVVSFFSPTAPVLEALRRINVNFLRVNVHVNSDSPLEASPDQDSDEEEEDEEEQDHDDADDSSDSDGASTAPKRSERRHLEMTIDMRHLPGRVGPPNGVVALANDVLMRERRQQQGAEANMALNRLRRHMETACEHPEVALRNGWEEHGAAERRRKESRARHEARFDSAEVGNAAGCGWGDERVFRGMKSLIISIASVGGELRAYRP